MAQVLGAAADVKNHIMKENFGLAQVLPLSSIKSRSSVTSDAVIERIDAIHQNLIKTIS